MSQKDLFEFATRSSVLPQANHETAAKNTFSFLEQTRISLRLDHLLTLSLALMVSMALVYTGGIEKGKHLTWQVKPLQTNMEPSSSQEKLPVDLKPESPVQIIASGDLHGESLLKTTAVSRTSFSQSETIISTKTTSSKPSGAYTIQLATYKSESVAQKRIELLSNQGLESFMIPSGSYYQVCVKGFQQKQEASRSLIQLKSKGIAPKDAYVRGIPA